MLNLAIYPRGFVGSPSLTTYNEEEKEIDLSLNRATLKLDLTSKRGYLFDDEITQMNHLVSKSPFKVLNDFDFKERLYIKAKTLLSFNSQINSFSDFLLTQLHCARSSPKHLMFLSDLVIYLTEGRDSLRASTWVTLLSTKDLTSLTPKEKEDFKSSILNYQRDNPYFNSLNKTISRWVGLENGHAHLLRTLYILYGEPLEDDKNLER